MWIAVFMSYLFNGLTRYAPEAMLDFLPSTFAFFFVVLNCKTKTRASSDGYSLVFLGASLFTIYMGYTAILARKFNSPYLSRGMKLLLKLLQDCAASLYSTIQTTSPNFSSA